jgi:MYXO-CTERM domain-containing protein
LLSSAAFAAPLVSAPIDVAPRLFVPSSYTSEAVLSMAAGGGAVAVLAQGGRLSLLTEDLAFIGDPIGRTFAASSVAFDGHDFLLASVAAQPPKGGSNYLAALQLQRVAPGGALTDPAIVLGDVQESGTFDSPVAIACKAPGDCLAAYSLRLYGAGGTTDKDIWVATVKDGVPGPPVHLTTAAKDQIKPTITWDGTNWIVVWVDLRFATYDAPNYKGTQIYGARVTTAGASLDPIGVPLATFAELTDNGNTTFSQPLPNFDLARSGGTTLLAWRGTGSKRIVGRRLEGDLALTDPTPIVIVATSAGSKAEAIRLLPATDGFTAVYGESGYSNESNVDVLGLGFDGQSKGAPAKAGSRTAFQVFAAKLSDNTIALGKTVPGPVNPYTDAWVERINTGGTELGSVYVTKSLTVVDGRALAQAPGIGVVVYGDNRTSHNGEYPTRQVFASVLGAGGSILPPDGLLLTTPPRNVVAAAAGAGHALVVWDEGTFGTRDVVGVLLDASGDLVKNVTFASNPYDESSPLAAFDGQDFVVSWVDRGNGYDAGVFRRLAPDGTFVDPAFVFVAPGQSSTTTVEDLVCNESGGCLARSGSSYRQLQNGAVTTTKGASEVGLEGFDDPLLAGGDSGFALLTKGATFADIALIRLAGDLAIHDDPAVDLFDANYVGSLVPKAKVVGWNGGRYVTAWTNSKGVSLASLPETGDPSLPYLLTQVSGVPGPYSSIGNEAARNLLAAGESDRAVIGYQDGGRLIVRSITDLVDNGGAGGAGGMGGAGGLGGIGGVGGVGGTSSSSSSSGAGGAGGSGTGGFGGTSGTTSSGGTGGAGGIGGTGGMGGVGGAGGLGGVGGIGGAGGPGGTSPGGATSTTSGADAPATGPNDSSGDDGGCGCRTAGSPDRSGGAWALLLGLGLMARKRNRRLQRGSITR